MNAFYVAFKQWNGAGSWTLSLRTSSSLQWGGVKWAEWRLILPTTRLFIQCYNEQKINFSDHNPLWGECIDDWCIPLIVPVMRKALPLHYVAICSCRDLFIILVILRRNCRSTEIFAKEPIIKLSSDTALSPLICPPYIAHPLCAYYLLIWSNQRQME